MTLRQLAVARTCGTPCRLVLIFACSAYFACATTVDVPNVTTYNVAFSAPAFTGPADNMPVGNGEAVANVWVDGVRNGSLGLLFGRSDAFSGDVQPMKLGRVRIELDPNPFEPLFTLHPPPCATGEPYKQHEGLIGDQNHFADPHFHCTSAATCVEESQKQCDTLPQCHSFAIDPDWSAGQVSELYTTGLEGGEANPAWTLWTRNCSASNHTGNLLFSQTLDLLTGTVTITVTPNTTSTADAGAAGAVPNVTIQIWSDVNSIGTDDSVYVEVSTSIPTVSTVYLDSWRQEPFQQSTSRTARGPCSPIEVLPDEFVTDTDKPPANAVGLYRYNNNSAFNKTMSDQMSARLASSMQDPLLGRTSGLLAVGESTTTSTITNDNVVDDDDNNDDDDNRRDFVRVNDTHLVSGAPSQTHTITIYAHTAIGCSSRAEFLSQVFERCAAGKTPAAARANHTAWWAAFWNRSWVSMSSSSSSSSSRSAPANANANANASANAKASLSDADAAATFTVSQAHYLQRYLSAIQSRGRLPVHHNGGTVTWGWNGTSHANPDERPWGGGYWFQNIRHPVWYALAAGDVDLMRPIFDMYLAQQPVLEDRSRQWFHHNGSQFAETSYFFGTYEPCDYGCGRSGVPEVTNPYIKHHYEGGVELAVMMLRAYFYSGDESLVAEYILPWCTSLLTFYDQHYPKYPNGTLFLQHAQSCETWLDCDNPTPQVSALHRIAEALTALPQALVPDPAQRALFARIAASLPAIPLTSQASALQVSPCAGGFPSRHQNSENTETYAIWPYEYFAVNRTGAEAAAHPLQIGLNTFNHVHFGHGNSAWRYDGQDAAMLGMAAYAWGFVRDRVLNQGRTEGSAFPGYLASDASDGAPQVESNGIVAETLQRMLVQTDGRRILVFPAFVRGVDVDFKLTVPGHYEHPGESTPAAPPAQIRVVVQADEVTLVEVTPVSRQADVVVLDRQ